MNTTTEIRIAEWTETSRNAADATHTPLAIFEQAIRDMRHAGYRLPTEIVAGVRANLGA